METYFSILNSKHLRPHLPETSENREVWTEVVIIVEGCQLSLIAFRHLAIG